MAPAAAANKVRGYDVPAGPLSQVLARFVGDAGILLAAASELTDGKQSPGLQGTYDIDAAFAALLAGTGLEAMQDAQGQYRLRAVRAEGSGQVMRAISVNADEFADVPVGTTEGTGSYKADAVNSSAGLQLSLRRTPQSVTVITHQQLQDMGTNELNVVMQRVPGIFVTQSDSERERFSSRGYSISNYLVDGALQSYGSGGAANQPANPDMTVYDRVEVIRGATGMMMGAGDPSGSINLTRKRPTPTWAGAAALTLGSWSNRRGEVDLGGPVAFDGRVRARAVAALQDRDDFRQFYERKRRTLYGIIEADITDSTVLAVGVEDQKMQTDGAVWGNPPYWQADGAPARYPRSINLSPRWSYWDTRETKTFATLEQRIGAHWSAKLMYSRTESDGQLQIVSGAAGYPRADGTGIRSWGTGWASDYEVQQEDVNLSVRGAVSVLGRRHEIVAGYLRSTHWMDEYHLDEAPMPPAFSDWPDWRTWDGNYPQPPITVLDQVAYHDRVRQSAGYAAANIDLHERLNAVVGVRYGSWETQALSYTVAGAIDSSGGYEVNDVFTPYAGVLFDLTHWLTAYVSYTDVFKPQNARDINNRYLDPIVGVNYEAGLKAEFFDGRLDASLAVFRSEQDNLAELDESLDRGEQQQDWFLLPGGARPHKSTGKGNTIEGWELQAQGQVTPAWNILAGFSRTLPRNAAGQRINTGVSTNLFRVFTTYRLPGRLERLTVGGGATWQGEFWSNGSRPTGAVDDNGAVLTVQDRMRQRPFALASLVANYRVADHITMALNVSNLLDKEYYRGFGYGGVSWGEPRNVSVTARVSF